MSVPLHLDFETRSTVDLKKTGVDVYARDPSTNIWCMAFAFGDEPVSLLEFVDVLEDGNLRPPGGPNAELIRDHVKAGGLLFAHNASFERTIWKHILTGRYGWPEPAYEQWRCTMVMGYAMALPGALEHIGPALNTGFEKDMAGNRLMKAMSRPRRPRKGEAKDALLWRESPEDLQKLYAYCRQDVEAERAADKRLVRLRSFEQDLWHLDQKINDRGVPVDVDLCQKALKIVETYEKSLDAEMARVTDWEVTACSNVNQLKAFAERHLGYKPESLDKESINEILVRDVDPALRRALELRQEGGLASVDKIEALLNGLSPDGRARHLLQFHAANTGRWGGRRFQPQNIKRPDENFDIDGAIDVLLGHPPGKAMDLLDTYFGAPITCISYTLRGMIKAPARKKIVAADFSNIEGRVLAWLAGETKKLAAFRAFDAGKGPDLYKVAAAGIYGVTPETVDKAQRQIGKVSELACGYGGGVGAFQTMAHTYGVKVPDEQADQIKTAWRDDNPNIVSFWYDLDEAAIRAVCEPGKKVNCGPVTFRMVGSFLWCQLPSGRALCYPYPKVMWLPTPWGQEKETLTFKTVPNISNTRKIVHADRTNTSKWARIQTYGGALSENVTQAVARDVLAEAMVRLEREGYPIILTVHDENVSEVDEGFGSATEYEEIMVEPAAWMGGLPVAAAGFEAERYRK